VLGFGGRLSLTEYFATNMSRDSRNVELRRQNRLSTLQWFIRSHFQNPSSCLIRCGQLYAPDRTKDNTEWCLSAREKLPDNVICSAGNLSFNYENRDGDDDEDSLLRLEVDECNQRNTNGSFYYQTFLIRLLTFRFECGYAT